MIEKSYECIRERIGREMKGYVDGAKATAHIYPKVDREKKLREGNPAVILMGSIPEREADALRLLQGRSVPFEEWEAECAQFAKDAKVASDVDRTVRVNY